VSIATCFAPVATADARILILGSMPGVASLQAQRYYAHPRNAFWPIMARLLDFPDDTAYDERLRCLTRARIALWDVLASCHRPGSLDSDIDPASQVVNDFDSFLHAHPHIALICFNGSKAATTFRRQVAPTLRQHPLRCVQLPSTSPAHAALPFDTKLARWRDALSDELIQARQSTA
jgi:hypoxanthine-DNA glycosylase